MRIKPSVNCPHKKRKVHSDGHNSYNINETNINSSLHITEHKQTTTSSVGNEMLVSKGEEHPRFVTSYKTGLVKTGCPCQKTPLCDIKFSLC